MGEGLGEESAKEREERLYAAAQALVARFQTQDELEQIIAAPDEIDLLSTVGKNPAISRDCAFDLIPSLQQMEIFAFDTKKWVVGATEADEECEISFWAGKAMRTYKYWAMHLTADERMDVIRKMKNDKMGPHALSLHFLKLLHDDDLKNEESFLCEILEYLLKKKATLPLLSTLPITELPESMQAEFQKVLVENTKEKNPIECTEIDIVRGGVSFAGMCPVMTSGHRHAQETNQKITLCIMVNGKKVAIGDIKIPNEDKDEESIGHPSLLATAYIKGDQVLIIPNGVYALPRDIVQRARDVKKNRGKELLLSTEEKLSLMPLQFLGWND